MKKLNLLMFSMLAFVLSGIGAGAVAPTAEETLSTIMGTVITSTVDLVTIVFTTYWPYILVIGIIGGLVGAFAKFAHIGSKR